MSAADEPPPTEVKRSASESDLLKESVKRPKAENEALKAKLEYDVAEAEKEEERQEEQWANGELCLREGYGYGTCGREPAFVSLDEAKAIHHADPRQEILWKNAQGRWWLDRASSYVEYHKAEGDVLYNSTDAHGFCTRCFDYGEVDGNVNRNCACCHKIWCLSCFGSEGEGDGLCYQCAAREDAE